MTATKKSGIVSMARAKRPWLASWLLTVTVTALLAGPAEARTRSYAILDAETGTVIKSVNADVQLHPASLTKMMTLYLVFEAVRSGKLSMDQQVTVSGYASRIPPSRLGLKQGQKVLVRHLVAAAAVRSANDAAVVLAEAVAGSEKEFARRMSSKARELGMYNTTFKNATGFTTRGHLSTARDMAILGRRLLLDFPEHAGTYKRRSIRWGGRRLIATNSRFLKAYPGADGIKTGYTRAAGYTIVASAKRNGRRLIVSYFGARSSARRTRRIVQIFNNGFSILKKKGPAILAAAPSTSPEPRSRASTTAVQAPAATTVPYGGWQVQIGAFGSSQRAHRHAQNVTNKYARLIGGGTIHVTKDRKLHVVRLAGYDRSTARRVCGSLKQVRVECFVLAQPSTPRQSVASAAEPKPSPQTTAQAAESAAKADTSGSWAVQVGAYSRSVKARGRLEQLRRAGINMLVNRDFVVPKSGKYYLARFTGFSEQDARLVCTQLQGRGDDCLVVQLRSVGESKDQQAESSAGAGENNWAVRVGTFRRDSSARRELNRVRDAKLDVLAGKEGQLLRVGSRTQVRFNGFAKHEARSACKLLSGRGFECMTVQRKAESSVQKEEGGWAIQVGAYGRASMARAQIRRVEGRDLKVLADAEAWVPKRGNYYLARFRNLDRQRATDACSALTERGVDCLALAPRR